MRLVDETPGDGRELIYWPAAQDSGDVLDAIGGPGGVHRVDVQLGDRSLAIYGRPTRSYLFAQRTYLPLSTLLMGLLCTLLAVVYVNSLLGRTAQVERLVIERTGELQHANVSLQQEVADRRRAEAVLKDSEALLLVAGREPARPGSPQGPRGTVHVCQQVVLPALGQAFRRDRGENGFRFLLGGIVAEVP